MKSQLHTLAQKAILDACTSLNISAQLEYRCEGYIPDVFITHGDKNYAFEIQITPQSLKKTRERQANYRRDGIVCCWLFEKEPSKIQLEMEELPIFKLDLLDGLLFVSLKGRKSLPIDTFVKDFISGKIKFCQHIKPLPVINVNFIEYPCWKCGALNHIYYLDNFHTPCNIMIYNDKDCLWGDKEALFNPKVTAAIQEYSKTDEGKHLVLPSIKKRFSNTVGKSYMSFGCSKCDTIFGDFYIHEAIIENIYEESKETVTIEAQINKDVSLYLPHWCHPGLNDFCE